MVGENIMIHHCGITHAADIINKRLRLFADILTLQKRNRFQRFFGIRRFLVFQQRVGFFYDFPRSAPDPAFPLKQQLFLQKLLPLFCQALFGGQGENALVCIVDHAFINQFFKIIVSAFSRSAL